MSRLEYNTPPISVKKIDGKNVSIFESNSENIDIETTSSFGDEWTKFNSFTKEEIYSVGKEYFDIVPDHLLNKKETITLDLGCGTGRWSIYLSDKVKRIESIDPSEAIFSAAQLCKNYDNINLSQASADTIPFDDNSFDFGISLGVLHHIPDTQKALNDLVSKIKPGGHALIYLYYALDNRSFFYKLLFSASNSIRALISKLPQTIKKFVCDIIAVTVYLPLIGVSYLVKSFGGNIYLKLPLSYYVNKSWNVIRNDALDRFGTPLEKRFTKEEITEMMNKAGLTNLIFSDKMPYWHVLARKELVR